MLYALYLQNEGRSASIFPRCVVILMPQGLHTYALLREALPLPLPDAATPSAPGAGLGVAPAIHPAKSKLPGAPPPAMALRVAPVIGEERDCFSNSARISGSTRAQEYTEALIRAERNKKKH